MREDIDIAQLRELYTNLDKLTVKVDSLTTVVSSSSSAIPPLVNFLDNSDFTYSDNAYNSASYTSNTNTLANWYARSQGSLVGWTKNSTVTESSESIRSSSHSGGARATAEWDTGTGAILLTGGYVIASPLPSPFCSAGNYLACRMQMTRVDGTNIGSGTKLKVSIYDNTDTRIIRGSIPSLVATKIGTHSGGTITRQYILEILMPDGKTFYSDTSSFTTGQNQVINSISPLSVDSNNYVNITLPNIVGASRYNLYRKATSGSDTNWYLVDSVPSTESQISDFGGTGGKNAWSIPSFDYTHKQYQVAEAYIDDLDEKVTETASPTEVIVGIRVPTNFVINGEQWLQIEFVKSDYSNSTTSEIPADSIYIDKIGLSYTNGRWFASSRDLTKNATPIIPSTPIPSGGGGSSSGSDGGSGIDNPISGGGYCVHKDTKILVQIGNDRLYLPASCIVIGDYLIAWNGKEFVPRRVTKIVNGISRLNYKISSRGKSLVCSFSHRLIADFDDFAKGTRIGDLNNTVLMYENGVLVRAKIEGFEWFNNTMQVISFKLDKDENYISDGFVSHNNKPIEDLYYTS